MMARIAGLAERVSTSAWCHLDIRDDNLLVRPDGRAVILDWGMSCAGASWLDELLLDLHVVDRPEFDALVAQRPTYPDADDLERDTTDMLLALGASLAVQAEAPARRGCRGSPTSGAASPAAHPGRGPAPPRPSEACASRRARAGC